MYVSIKDKDYYSIHINSQIYYFENLEKYIRNKKLIQRIKPNTLKTILSTLKIFIYWTMANNIMGDEDLALYLARFLEDEENGFKIYNTTYVEELDESIEYLEINIKAKQPSTLNKDKAIIEDYLKETNQSLFSSFNLEKNVKAYNHQKKHSKGDGYGLRMGEMAQSAFLDDISILPNRDTGTEDDIKAFPYELYEELLKIARPRERLIYLLAGSCSARVSQVLNLTSCDFDYNNKNVWLIDPRSNNQLGIHGVGRKTFLEKEYNINASIDKPHKNIGFKAPIPLRSKERAPLFWLSNIYKQYFFETLLDCEVMIKQSRIPRHPFLFVTRTGKRLTPQQVHTTFKAHCNKLKKIYPEYANRLDGIGLHSLRHMFGAAMATLQAKIIMHKKSMNYFIPPDQLKIITKEAMGHKSLSSTDIYFNRPWNLDIELGEHINTVFQSLMDTMSIEDKEKRYGIKRYA